MCIIYMLLEATMANAQTIHTIVFCNTIDQSIGQSMSIEFLNMKNQVRTWAGLIDYDEDHHELDGRSCTRANLKAVIDDMDVEPDDVILTFYGGHGSHAENDPDPWPQYLKIKGIGFQWLRCKSGLRQSMLDFLLSYQIAATWFKVRQQKSHYGPWEETTQDLMKSIAKITRNSLLLKVR